MKNALPLASPIPSNSLGEWHSDQTAMECQYRQHLIFPVASFDSAIGDWTASVHIEFTEKLKIHTVVLKSGAAFQSEVQAKKFIIEQAKEWVDERLANEKVSFAVDESLADSHGSVCPHPTFPY
jgi:hypothetical protein